MRRRLPFHNLRSYVRRPVNWPAQVTLAGQRPVPCRVRDISEQGALLEFSGRAPTTTDSLHLKIATIGFDGTCQVKHRSSRLIGVQF